METIRIIYHQDEGSWWAESPDLDRWSAAGETYDEVVKLAEEGVVFVLGHEAEIEHFVPASERAPA